MMPKTVKGNEAQSPLEQDFRILPHLASCGIYGERGIGGYLMTKSCSWRV